MLIALGEFGLAALFLVAGTQKLRDWAAFRRTVDEFGAPPPLAGLIGTLVPFLEIAVTGCLLFVPTLGAILGAVLLTVFTASLIVNLIQGQRPACQCFGALSAKPIGWSTVVRNLVFLVLAALLIVLDAPHRSAQFLRLSLTWKCVEILGLGTMVVLGVLADWFLRTRKTALSGLPKGTLAPFFRLPATDGHKRTLTDLTRRGKPVLLLFSDIGCGACVELMIHELEKWQASLIDIATLAILSSGPADDNEYKAKRYAVTHYLLDEEGRIRYRYRVPGPPSAALVTVEGFLAQPIAIGPVAVRALVQDILKEQPVAAPIADPTPASPEPPPAPPATSILF